MFIGRIMERIWVSDHELEANDARARAIRHGAKKVEVRQVAARGKISFEVWVMA